MCSYKFIRESDLRRHRTSCKGVRNRCDKCGAGFKNRTLLNEHVLWDPSCGRLAEIKPGRQEGSLVDSPDEHPITDRPDKKAPDGTICPGQNGIKGTATKEPTSPGKDGTNDPGKDRTKGPVKDGTRELVRVKVDEDKDVVGLKSLNMLDGAQYRRSGRRVSCGVCIGCTRYC